MSPVCINSLYPSCDALLRIVIQSPQLFNHDGIWEPCSLVFSLGPQPVLEYEIYGYYLLCESLMS